MQNPTFIIPKNQLDHMLRRALRMGFTYGVGIGVSGSLIVALCGAWSGGLL